MSQNEEKNPSIETDPEMTQLIEFVDKSIMRVIMSCYNYILYVQEGRGKHKHFEEKRGRYKKTQIEFSKRKNTMSKEKTYRNYFKNFLAINTKFNQFKVKSSYCITQGTLLTIM